MLRVASRFVTADGMAGGVDWNSGIGLDRSIIRDRRFAGSTGPGSYSQRKPRLRLRRLLNFQSS
jgi:hypothetical protein